MPIISCSNLSFQYPGSNSLALHFSDTVINKGDHVLIQGDSGQGKTTFLNLISGLLNPHSGEVHVLGTNLKALSPTRMDRFRSDHMGIIFQLFNLVPHLSVSQNIILPCYFSRRRKASALGDHDDLPSAAMAYANQLDIPVHLMPSSVSQLSIGEQQRVAIARALIGSPDIIIADEPTSALDPKRRDQFMALLLNACNNRGITLVLVSHDPSIQSFFDHRLQVVS